MEKLRLEIIKMLNESGLPLEASLFIIRDIYRDIQEAIEREKLNKEHMKQEEKENDN